MNELDFIRTLRSLTDVDCNELVRGIGDDCAVFKPRGGNCWVTTCDLLVENIHFIKSWHPPQLLGRKSASVNLSDVAAMGAEPKFCLLSLALPQGTEKSWLESFIHGFYGQLAKYNCQIIGGDTTAGERLTISVTLFGTASCESLLYRSGAQEGDLICVTGKLGSSSLGLALLQLKKSCYSTIETGFINTHFCPEPRVQLGQALAESRKVHAMQDISDGLSTDLHHICQESGVSACIEEESLPEDVELQHLCKAYSLSSLDLQLNGGEDYELLLCLPERDLKDIQQIGKGHGCEITPIGRINTGSGLTLKHLNNEMVDILPGGFEHTIGAQ